MSHSATGWAWRADASGNAKLVLLAISDFADDEGCCYPGQQLLARMTGLSERSVRSQLAELEKAGLLTRTGRWRKDGTRTSDAFQLNGQPADFACGPKDNRQKMSSLPANPAGDPVRDPVRDHIEQPRKEPSYPPEFEDLWKAYPKRAGSNPKDKAFRAYKKIDLNTVQPRPIEAVPLLAGVMRYRRFCEATGKIGTEYVMQTSRFFGPEAHWREPWDIPAPKPYAHNGRRYEEPEVIPPPMLPK